MGKEGRTLICTTKEAAQLFGVSAQALTKWTQSGCPGRIGPNTWDVGKTIQWKYPAEKLREREELADMELRKLAADVEYRQHRLARLQKEIELLREKYLSKEDVQEAWAYRVRNVRENVTPFIAELPGKLVGKSAQEMEGIIDEEVRNLLENLARG